MSLVSRHLFCTMKVQLLSAACALLALTTQCSAFGVAVPHTASRICIPGQTESTTRLNIFGNLKGAFPNDDSLGKVDATPGLKGVSGMNSWRDHCLVRHELCQICSHPLLIHFRIANERTCGIGRDQTSASAPSTASQSRRWPAKRCRKWPQRHE